MNTTTYELCEALADIAYIAGKFGYYSGNSRQDVSDFISWAQEFEELFKNKEWGIDGIEDYFEEVEKFAIKKIKEGITQRVITMCHEIIGFLRKNASYSNFDENIHEVYALLKDFAIMDHEDKKHVEHLLKCTQEDTVQYILGQIQK